MLGVTQHLRGRRAGSEHGASHCLPAVPALRPLAGLGHAPLPPPPSQNPSTQANSTWNRLLNGPCTFQISLIISFPSMHLPVLSSCAGILAAHPGSVQIPLPIKYPASPQHPEPLRSRTLTIFTFCSWPLDTQHCPAVLPFVRACIRPSIHLSTRPIFSRHLPCARRCSVTSLVHSPSHSPR